LNFPVFLCSVIRTCVITNPLRVKKRLTQILPVW
jgi:hypothetical protein